MKLLQVNGYELPGMRFNGLSLRKLLADHGIDSTHIVWDKDSADPNVHQLGGPFSRKMNRLVRMLEQVLSLQSVLHLHALELAKHPKFREADVVHYHIIHSGYLSMLMMPKLTQQKPSVWTLHDPWPMTGHCIYPFDCERWKIGCGSCPYLSTHFALRSDRTSLLFKLKHYAYSRMEGQLIVASKWMAQMVAQSPLLTGFRCHVIPFGIDLDRFVPPDDIALAKEKLGIGKNRTVLCFRAVDSEFKGLSYIIQALETMDVSQPICLLTFNTKGLLEKFRDRFQIIEFGWTNDEQLTIDAYQATDIFLMPSTAEAFGMMAIEAMACGKPVISFEGTSLPEVTNAPECGVTVPMKDAKALASTLERLITNQPECRERGQLGRKFSERNYDARMQVDRLAEVYRSALEAKNS